MWDILKRFLNLFRGASYRLLHELETVETQSLLAIEDFKKNIDKLQDATRTVGASLESFKLDRDEAQKRVNDLRVRIDRLLDAQEQFATKGEQENADQMEEQVLKDADELALAEQDLALYESSVASNQPKFDALIEQIKEQKRDQKALEQELRHLKSQYKVAKQELEISKMLNETTSDSIRSRVDDIRQRVKDKSSAARAQQAMNDALSTKPNKEVQNTLNSLNASSKLAELRAQRKAAQSQEAPASN